MSFPGDQKNARSICSSQQSSRRIEACKTCKAFEPYSRFSGSGDDFSHNDTVSTAFGHAYTASLNMKLRNQRNRLRELVTLSGTVCTMSPTPTEMALDVIGDSAHKAVKLVALSSLERHAWAARALCSPSPDCPVRSVP